MTEPFSKKKIAWELVKRHGLKTLGYGLTGVFAYETGKTISEQIRTGEYGEATETALKTIAIAKLSGSAIRGAIKGWTETRPSLEESLKRFKARTRLEMGQAKEAIAEVGGKQAGASIQTFQYRTTVRIPQKGKLRTLTIGKTTGKSKVLSLGPKGAYKIKYEWKFGPLRGKGVEAGKLKLENIEQFRERILGKKGVETILKEKARFKTIGTRIEQYRNLAEARFKDLFKRRSFENLPTYINIEEVRGELTSLGEIPLGKSLRPTKQLMLSEAGAILHIAKEEKGRAKALLGETGERLTEVETRFKKTPGKALTAIQTEREILAGLGKPRTAVLREYVVKTTHEMPSIRTEKILSEEAVSAGVEAQKVLKTVELKTVPKKLLKISSKAKLIKTTQKPISAFAPTMSVTEKPKEVITEVKQKPVEIEVIKTGETKKIRLTLTKFRELLKKKFGFAPSLEELKEKITKAKEKAIEKSKQGEKAFEKIISGIASKIKGRIKVKEKGRIKEGIRPKERVSERIKVGVAEKVKMSEKQILKPKLRILLNSKLISKQLPKLKQKLVPKIKYRALTTQMPIPFPQTPKIPYVPIPKSFGFVGKGKGLRGIKIRIKEGKPFLKPFADLLSLQRMDIKLSKMLKPGLFIGKHPTPKQFGQWLKYFEKMSPKLPTYQELLKKKRKRGRRK